MEILKKYKEKICFWGFLLVGMFMFFHQFIFSGFDEMPGSLLDARLINYILEHIYSWITGLENHQNLFSMPFYYPVKNTLFFSDTFLSAAPIYIFYRMFFDPYHSYGFFVMTIVALNYVSFYFLLKKVLKIDIFFVTLGAFLFAFSLMSYFSLLHPQMLTQFFTIFSVLCLLNVSESNSEKKNYVLFIMFGFLVACQFYSSFYLGFLAYLCCLLLGVIYLPFFIFSREVRLKTINFIKRYYKPMLAGFCMLLLLLIPLGYFYLQTNMSRVAGEMYRPVSVFYSGSILWKRFIPELSILYCPWYKNNFGLITIIIAGLGLYKYNKKFFALIIICYLIMWDKCPVNFPEFAFYHIPGASAIRYWMRIVFLMLPFVCFGAVYFLSGLKSKFVLFLLMLLIFTEQVPAVNYYGWKRSVEIQKMKILEKKISPECKVIKVTGASDPAFSALDSMWFAHYRKVYSRVGFTAILESQLDMPDIYIPSKCIYQEKYSVTHPINIYN